MKIPFPVRFACAAAALSLILSLESWATAVSIANPGFESPALADNGFVGTDLIGGGSLGIPGWSLFNPSSLTHADLGVWNVSSAAYPAEAPEGSNVSFLWAGPADVGSGPIGIQQTLTERLATNTRYDLSVRIGDPLNYAPAELSGFPGYAIELLAGTTVLVSDHNSLSISEGSFGSQTLSFTSGTNHPAMGEPLTIRLTNLIAGPGREVDFDDVRMTATAMQGIEGDFDSSGVLDINDINQLATAVAEGQNAPNFDLTGDGQVTIDDVYYWTGTLANTWTGDVNLDGEFNTSDLIVVSAAGKYEISTQALWSEGDWNADGLFASDDLIFALQDGGYEQGPRGAVAAIPEPSALWMTLAGIAVLLLGSRLLRTVRDMREPLGSSSLGRS